MISVLELRNALEARKRLHELIRNERACCGFFAFELHEAASEIRLIVKAPEAAREAAEALLSSSWLKRQRPLHAHAPSRRPG